MVGEQGVNKMSDFHLNTLKKIEVFSSVSERITQLNDLKTTNELDIAAFE